MAKKAGRNGRAVASAEQEELRKRKMQHLEFLELDGVLGYLRILYLRMLMTTNTYMLDTTERFVCLFFFFLAATLISYYAFTFVQPFLVLLTGLVGLNPNSGSSHAGGV